MESLGSAQGAVDSLLGTLAVVVKDEARLLGNVAGDVQFLTDEMESMNGFLLHVSEASEDDDHQVRSWMKQVRDVAVQSERWVQRYQRWASTAPRGGGLLGCVRRMPHSLFTISERHEIAAKIKQLKARAYEVGERRHRYGVQVPPKRELPVEDHPQADRGGGDQTEEHQYARRSCLVDPKASDITEEEKSDLIRWLTDDDRTIPIPQLRVIRTGGDSFKSKVFDDDSVATRFDTRIWITANRGRVKDKDCEFDNLLSVLQSFKCDLEVDATLSSLRQIEEIIAGKRFLLVVDGIKSGHEWLPLARMLKYRGDLYGSTVVVIMRDPSLIKSSCYRSLDKVEEIVGIYAHRAIALVHEPDKEQKVEVLKRITTKLASDLFCCKMLLHLLYVQPNRTVEHLEGLCGSLRDGEELNNAHQMLLFSYNELSTDYRKCLLYLCVYPEDWKIRRTCLLTRWIAEGMTTSRPGLISSDAADRCFDALLDRGLLLCLQTGASGKAKFVAVPEQVFQFIAETAKAEKYAVLSLPPSLAPYVSVDHGIQIQHIPKELRQRNYCFRILRSIFSSCKHDAPPEEAEKADPIVALLASLPLFERDGLLKVLDLESCRGFQKFHMKNICRISELRYLNLRGTDVTELPREIDILENLETLDIRETEITVLPTKFIFLRKIRCLLAGNRTGRAVSMPYGIGNMTKIQILSYVEVSEDSEKLLDDLGQLQRLRKLGVILVGQREHDLLVAVDKLDKTLRSMSIWRKLNLSQQSSDKGFHKKIRIPGFLESIKMRDFGSGLPEFATRSNQLVKVTLQNTSLLHDDMHRLGWLPRLYFLRLHSINMEGGKSDGNQLVFMKDDFQNLKFLILEHVKTNINGLSFEQGAAHKLENIEWSDSNVTSLSGIIHLTRLDKIAFYGSCISDQVKEIIAENPRSINVFYNLSV